MEVRTDKENDTVWLTQDEMAVLFDVDRTRVVRHINNIYQDGELSMNSTCAENAQVQIEGNRKVSRKIKIYNLDRIISVGYRVKSKRGIVFRKWANDVIEEFMKKGFVLDDRRLEDPSKFGHDYFDELLSRIKAIRASEKRFYQKILEIYSTSIDYNQNDEETILFFKTVQNKLHYAISGETAAELIYQQADSKKDNMGLTS